MKPHIYPFPFFLFVLKGPPPQMGFLFFSVPWKKWRFFNGYPQWNLMTKQWKSLFSSTRPPLKRSWHFNYKIEDCRIIHNNNCSFQYFFCYFYVKSLVLKALSLSPYPRILYIFVSERLFKFLRWRANIIFTLLP